MPSIKDAEYPQEIVSLFHECGHNRREFMERAANATLGTLTAAGIFEGLTSNLALAQPAPKLSAKRPKTVAIIGVGHYHATLPPNYIRLLQNQKLEIVGVHDPDPEVADNRAKIANSVAFDDYKAMINKTKPDFVLSLNRHAAMPAPIRFLIDTGIPFLAEKPWGIDAKTVNDLAEYAEKKNAWATAPMSFRYNWWAQTAKKMVQSGELGTISHMLVRFNQPGIQRYIDEGNEWMISKPDAGGGALLNLGIHGFDLCRYITGEEPQVVSAVTSHSIWNADVEDYAHVTLRTPSGIVFLNEASYTFPTNGSDTEHKVAAKNAIVRTNSISGDSVQIIAAGRNETIKAPADFVTSWAGVIKDCLDRLGRGEPPPSSAHDCARAVSLTFDAYKKAGEA